MVWQLQLAVNNLSTRSCLPRAEILRKQPYCGPDLLQNPDFGPVGAAPGSSVMEILASPKADNLEISELSKGGATRLESTSDTAERILLSISRYACCKDKL